MAFAYKFDVQIHLAKVFVLTLAIEAMVSKWYLGGCA